jgi:hypothetical protein
MRWENGLGGFGRLKRIFEIQMHGFQAKKSKKIRFNLPNPPNPFSYRISTFQNRNDCNFFQNAASQTNE